MKEKKTVEIEIDRGHIAGVAVVEASVYFKTDTTFVPYMEGSVPMKTTYVSAIRIDDVKFYDEDNKITENFQLTPDEIALATFQVEKRV
jgi:hypothetical protein